MPIIFQLPNSHIQLTVDWERERNAYKMIMKNVSSNEEVTVNDLTQEDILEIVRRQMIIKAGEKINKTITAKLIK